MAESKDLNVKDVHASAFHEAGHAVVARHFGIPVNIKESDQGGETSVATMSTGAY